MPGTENYDKKVERAGYKAGRGNSFKTACKAYKTIFIISKMFELF